MKDNTKANWGIITPTIVLFVFGLMTTIIGWQATDKLSSIDKTLQKLELWIMEEKATNSTQNSDIRALQEKTANNESAINELKHKPNGQNN